MHRKILLAEQVDTMRTVAESILRQNGYEVIAVTAAEKAREVLEYTRPDLMIVGADLVSASGDPFCDQLKDDPRTSDIPLLLFAAVDGREVGFPEEVIIPRPFDPRDFLHRVSLFVSGQEQQGAASGAVSETEIDDDFLDAALGLDRSVDHIDVTDSEVMDKTVVGSRKTGQNREKLIGMESTGSIEITDTAVEPAVESMIIDEDSDRARQRTQVHKKPPTDGTGKLEILSDQYGLVENEAGFHQQEDGVHDYNWFIDSMQQDVNKPAHQPGQQPAQQPGDSAKLHITENSAAVDPVTPGPSTPFKAKESAAVEHFIDEFKREMEQLQATDDSGLMSKEAVASEAASDRPAEDLGWEDKLEHIGPAQVDLFTREFAHELAEKVAQMIAQKIDPDKLLHLFRTELARRLDKKS